MPETKESRATNNAVNRKEEIFNKRNIVGKRNKAWIIGEMEDDLKFNHIYSREVVFEGRVKTLRLSGTVDFVPILIPRSILHDEILGKSLKGKTVEVAGKFNSYNQKDENGKVHTKLFLFAKLIRVYEKEKTNANTVYFEGKICKEPVFRETQNKERKITNLLIVINEHHSSSTFIPCIAWGKNAYYSRKLKVGNRIQIGGRIQSREYRKENKFFTTYEVSVKKIKKIE